MYMYHHILLNKVLNDRIKHKTKTGFVFYSVQKLNFSGLEIFINLMPNCSLKCILYLHMN